MDLTILFKKQRDLLDTLKKSVLLNSNFYLAEGTGLALQLSHRRSVDFDFFTPLVFFPIKLIEKLKNHFQPEQINIIEMEEDTLITIIEDVQTSFFHYKYPLLKTLITENGLNIASIEDIAAMKVISIMQRGLNKNFVDLWMVIMEREYSLRDIFSFCHEKYDSIFSESIALKALTYFKDAEDEIVNLKLKDNISWKKIKKDFLTMCREYLH